VTHREKPFAITLDVGTSLANRTGSWRTERPVYVHRLPPCNNACPAGENIQGWLHEAEEGRYEMAWRILTADNPLPGVHGRVCYHPCEDACNRGQLDTSVNIHAIERFLGDEALRQGWTIECGPQTGKRVLIVGAGPSGLSAAYHLRRLGHAVVIHDAGEHAGGMMRYGIPQYRLPRDVLDAEIARIEGLGVVIRSNSKVEDLEATIKAEGCDAAFVAVGAHLAKRIDIPARDASGILDAVSVLRDVERGAAPSFIGRRVAVYGGGNTALDVARTAERLGAEEAMLIYRRSRAQMPAHEFEVAEAIEEGIKVHWLSTISGLQGSMITIEKMALDENGWPKPTGEFETLLADTVILALGQAADTAFLAKVGGVAISQDGVVKVDETMMTGHAGVFAGGDMVPAERSVTVAVGHGKLAARNIDAYLRGERYQHPPRPELASVERLNTWYFTDADQSHQAKLEMARRLSTFKEIVQGLDAETALFESRRCLSCGNCFECDNCYGVCPDNAVKKLGPGLGYAFNYDFCKGCGMCAAECPCGAIAVVPEQM
jgi:NADPH-dependent glutamate synthase beta subunit-like oxidoreductase